MARPVEIDRDQAFRKAGELFWRRGYTATSLNDLLQATGMGKGSFYAAFGSKEGLFEATLDWYHESSAAARRKVSETHKGIGALREFLDATMIEVSEAKRRRGCLLVNSVIELEGVKPDLHRRARRYLQALEDRCMQYLEEARSAGEIREYVGTTELAALTASLLQGLRVAANAKSYRYDITCTSSVGTGGIAEAHRLGTEHKARSIAFVGLWAISLRKLWTFRLLVML